MPAFDGNPEGIYQFVNPHTGKNVQTPAEAFPSPQGSPERPSSNAVQPEGVVPFGSRLGSQPGLRDRTNTDSPSTSSVFSERPAHAGSENGVASGLPSQCIPFTPPTSPPLPKRAQNGGGASSTGPAAMSQASGVYPQEPVRNDPAVASSVRTPPTSPKLLKTIDIYSVGRITGTDHDSIVRALELIKNDELDVGSIANAVGGDSQDHEKIFNYWKILRGPVGYVLHDHSSCIESVAGITVLSIKDGRVPGYSSINRKINLQCVLYDGKTIDTGEMLVADVFHPLKFEPSPRQQEQEEKREQERGRAKPRAHYQFPAIVVTKGPWGGFHAEIMGAALSRIRKPRLNELQAHDAIESIVRRYKKAIIPSDYDLLFKYHAQLRAQVLRILPGRLDNVRTIHVEAFSVVKDVGKDYAKQLILKVDFDDGLPSQRWSFNITHHVKELTHTLPAYKVFYDAVDLMPFFSRKKADSIKKCVIDDLSRQFPTISKCSADNYATKVAKIQQKIAMKLSLIGCQIPDGRRPQLARLEQPSAGRYVLTINLINTVEVMSEAIAHGRTVSCKGEWISIAVEDFDADVRCIQEAEKFTFEGLNIKPIVATVETSEEKRARMRERRGNRGERARMRERRGNRGGGSSVAYGGGSSASNL